MLENNFCFFDFSNDLSESSYTSAAFGLSVIDETEMWPTLVAKQQISRLM